MRQTFTVTTPATDPSLLTIEQLRFAAGLAEGDASRDPELSELGLRISAEIAVECNVASDGVHPPTLRRETVEEAFWHSYREAEIFLARRFVLSVATITEQDVSLISADYVLDREVGMLSRISSGRPWHWYTGALSVSYIAGFDDVPADLAGAALDLARHRLSTSSRDPLVKGESVEVPDVLTRRTDYWVGSTPGSSRAIPADIAAKLARYVNIAIA